ncbi:MAG: arginyltransferase [Planctomycetes bacterium]|nr:arginyltransferase [Planctomycetota bacterium]
MDDPQFHRLPGLDLPLLKGGRHKCPYLPRRMACELFTFPALGEIDDALYERMMNLGFRRAGTLFYKPTCPRCAECVPIRVPVDRFRWSKSQRRIWKRSSGLRVSIGPPTTDDEHYAVYCAYQCSRHDERPPSPREGFEELLGPSPITTIELALRAEQRLIAVSIIDVCPTALSSVYCYFDPAEARRAPGTLTALHEIRLCRAMQRPYWYSGFYVAGCRKMEYKLGFRPWELRDASGNWRAPTDDDPTDQTRRHAGDSRPD